MSSASRPRRLSSRRRDVVAEIVRLIVPAYPDLCEAERTRVHSGVTAFVASQIESLPAFLAVPYGVGITAFELLPVFRFSKRFASLEDPAKQAYLSLWSEGPIGPARDFVKLIRSCALLAYFDHPDVRRNLPAPRIFRSAPVAAASPGIS